MTNLEHTKKDLAFLTAEIVSPPDQLLLLRSSLEAALMRLGHEPGDIIKAVDEFYVRTLH